MANFDIKVIQYALDKLIENDNTDQFIKETAKRTRAVIDHIEINGPKYIGVTLDKFVRDLENKPNVFILSDDQLNELYKLQILSDALAEANLKLEEIDKS